VKQKTVTPVPVIISLLFHAAIFASLFVAFDFDRTPDLAMPLALNATLVTENAVVIPPQVEEPAKVEKPPPPQPDTREQERLAAEQKKREEEARVEEARAEEARLQKIERAKEEAEKQRLAEQERKRKEAEAEEERRRLEAEEQRKADIERQRLENEQARREAEDVARKEAAAEEAQMLESRAASEKAAYIFKIQQKVTRNWVQPITAEKGLNCVVKVTQTAGGVVTNVEFGSCNGDATVRRSIEAAVQKASPLPAPRDPSVFDREVTLNFKT
jgi:colicin import membrane protein